MAQSEEAKVIEAANSTEVLTAFSRIPYALLNQEVEGNTQDVLAEMTEICKYYKVYKKGMDFTVEGSNGDYVPATLRYKMAASLINKEARFLFAESPDVTVDAKGDVGQVSKEAKDELTNWNDLLKSVLDANLFEKALLQAAKDCFIGKRVAGVVNFNEEDGVTITFLPATQFLFETRIGNDNILTKFVCFIVVKDSTTLNDKRVFKKKYTLINGVVHLEERMYDGAGREVSAEEFEPTEQQPTKLATIPAVVFLNDGLTGDSKGESEIDLLQDYEQYYSKLANGDIDAERKTMNPTRYAIDMDQRSTKGLSSSAGAFWDLQSDQNLDHPAPKVGMLESAMNYSEALKTSLDRIKTVGYEQVDMPNITLETMTGAITSGKALKAIYWPLIVRCKEKMKMWGPKLRQLAEIVFEGALAYPNTITKYVDTPLVPVAHEIHVEQNTPLPEDELEERNMDLAEVAAQTMSKKSYMKKWRGLTDDEAQEELEQIALERQIIDDNTVMPRSGDQLPYPDATKDQMDQQAEEQQEQDTLEDAAEGTMDDITGGVE
jgi:hypothetical protein